MHTIVTTAKDNDAKIDLSKTGVVVYSDKRYFGSIHRGTDATMDRAVRDHRFHSHGHTAKEGEGSSSCSRALRTMFMP